MPWMAKRAASRRVISPQGAGDGVAHEVLSTGAFPLEFPAQWESQGIRETSSWGPQTVFLFCVFGWLLLGTLWEPIPQGIAIALALSFALIAALSVIVILRRHARRAVLVHVAGEIGVYREGRFAYQFSASALRKDSWDWLYTMKMLILIGMLVLLTGGLLAVALRDLSPGEKDLWAFAYLFGYACFAFAAIVRSQLLLVWYWIPEGPEGGMRRVGFPRGRARELLSAS